jgi:dTMP kinase
MNTQGLFITFEGIDGSGKGTQLYNLIHHIKCDKNGFIGNKYTPIWITREPTHLTESGRSISKKIREENVNGEIASKLFIDDRIEHTQKFIIPRMKEGNIVLCDRYDISTYAYQTTQGIDFDLLYDLHNYPLEAQNSELPKKGKNLKDLGLLRDDHGGAIVPDITIVLMVNPEIAFDRVHQRNGILECFEEINFQKRLHDQQKVVLVEISKRQPNRKFIIVDGSRDIEFVTSEIIRKISELLDRNKNHNFA